LKTRIFDLTIPVAVNILRGESTADANAHIRAAILRAVHLDFSEYGDALSFGAAAVRSECECERRVAKRKTTVAKAKKGGDK
jgi:hypothetical protein